MGLLQSQQQKSFFLFGIALGILLNPLNSSMISVAIPRLQSTFNQNFAVTSSIIYSFYLASAISQPVMGKIADLIGQKRLFLIGLLLVLVACLVAPLTPALIWLVVLRVFQSIGSVAVYPVGMGLVRHNIKQGQAKALAILTVFSSASAALGPTIGGLLIHTGDWPAIFLINIPIILISFSIGWWLFPNDLQQKKKGNHKDSLLQNLDGMGIFLFIVFMLSLLWFLLSLRDKFHWWIFILSLISGILFVRQELRTNQPFIDFKMLFHQQSLLRVYVQYILVNTMYYSIFFGMPSYMQNHLHFDVKTTGLLMLFVAGFGVIVAPIAGRWIDRSGIRPALLLSSLTMLICSLGTFGMKNPSIGWLIVVLSLAGISNGLSNVGLQSALFIHSPSENISSESGLFMTCRYLGAILSSVLLAFLFGKHFQSRDLLLFGGILVTISLVFLWISWLIPRGSSLKSSTTSQAKSFL